MGWVEYLRFWGLLETETTGPMNGDTDWEENGEEYRVHVGETASLLDGEVRIIADNIDLSKVSMNPKSRCLADSPL